MMGWLFSAALLAAVVPVMRQAVQAARRWPIRGETAREQGYMSKGWQAPSDGRELTPWRRSR